MNRIEPKTNTCNKNDNGMWKNVPPFKGKTDQQIKELIKAPLGKKMFGKDDDGKIAEKAYIEMIAELDLCNDHYYAHIPAGEVARMPDKASDVDRVVDDLRACVSSHLNRKQDKLADASDDWAKQHRMRGLDDLFDKRGKKCTHRMTNQTAPRFSATPITTLEEFLISRSVESDTRGFLAEEYVLSFLNHHRMQCPECRVSGHIASCGGCGDGQSCSGFRDGICLSCAKRGVTTLFEIKTRNERAVKEAVARTGAMWIKAGNFIGLMALLAQKVNVYMIVLSRDTGSIRFGKIRDVRLDLCEIYCYNAQTEGRLCSTPGSQVMIRSVLLPMSMPPMNKWLTTKQALETNQQALDKVLAELE